MNNDNSKSNDPLSNQRPVFLSSENPDTLSNPEVKVIPSNANQFVQPQENIPPSVNLSGLTSDSNVANSRPNLVQDPGFQNGSQVQSQNYQPSPSVTFAPNPNPVAPVANKAVEPIRETVVKEKIVYKDGGGSNFFGNILAKLFNCIGCTLFIVSILIIAFVYFVNF